MYSTAIPMRFIAAVFALSLLPAVVRQDRHLGRGNRCVCVVPVFRQFRDIPEDIRRKVQALHRHIFGHRRPYFRDLFRRVGMGERIHGCGQRSNPYSDIRQRLERSHRICQRGDPCRSEGRSRGSQVGRDSPDFSLAVGFPHGDYRRFLCLRLRKMHIFDVL